MMRRWVKDEGGAAAAELALWLTVMVVLAFSVVELALYSQRRAQVELAAQAAAAAAWKLCGMAPASCSTGLVAPMTQAAQGTSLGSGVTIVSGQSSEGWYCVDGGGGLALQGSTAALGTAPANQTTCPGNTSKPGDYVRVQVSYTHTPLYSALAVNSLLPSPITKEAWMRLR